MALFEFKQLLKEAKSVLDLTRRLGERCLESSGELKEMRSQPSAERELRVIKGLVERTSLADWEAVVKRPATFEQHLGTDLAAAVKRAKARQPLDFLAVLRGLCSRPLHEFFETASSEVELTKGLPVPFATRPLPDALVGETTSKQETVQDASLLYPLSFDLYAHDPGEGVRVRLDFAHAKRLDALTWEEEKKLPLIATLHPKGSGDFKIGREGGGRFFGVQPEHWDVTAIKELLSRAKAAGARVAVLPELCLPDPKALERELSRDAGSYPEIVVAGSAHSEPPSSNGRRRRVNESRTYLEGKCVSSTHKHKAFKTKKLGAKTFKKPQWEDLTDEPKTITILSGRRTRLGVAICADLQGTTIPRLLEDAGVNLLLAPSMTPKIGSFAASLGGIASYCQGVAAMANTRWADDGKPFLCMCAVPRPHPHEQVDALCGNGSGPAPELAIFDPNEPLPEAVRWL